MRIIISNSCDVPIYEQVKQAIINQILTGELEENESLPSIRNLAKDIRISVMTVKKAYDELEQEGYIITRQGKGSFVSFKNLEFIKEEKQRQIEEHIFKIIEIANQCDITKSEIIDLFEYIYGSENNE